MANPDVVAELDAWIARWRRWREWRRFRALARRYCRDGQRLPHLRAFIANTRSDVRTPFSLKDKTHDE